MNLTLARLLLGFLAFSPIIAVAQRGKDLNYTVTITNDIVNTYTVLTANAAANSTLISVASNALSGAHFTGNLAAGDLILIIQMQGASMNISTNNTTFTSPIEYQWENPVTWSTDAVKIAKWGEIIANGYNNCGKYELAEVLSVSGTTGINLSCPLVNSYTSTGRVQIVRVPRYQNLTLNTGTSIVPIAWGATNTGGVIAVEVNGNLAINGNAKLTASGRGFRGAVADNSGNIFAPSVHGNGAGNGGTQIGSAIGSEGGRKGEGIGGYVTEYTAQYSNYGRGAPANGGGGGGFQNAGGGGGANVGVGTYTGKGVPSNAYSAAAWNLELPNFATSSSSGGGRGGYALATVDLNATIAPNGPNYLSWSGGARQENGGYGGHALIQDATRVFMGGGGGAGDQNNGKGGDGGAGGGIILAVVYGTISGTGTFEADGANGISSKTVGTTGIGQKQGHDGAGGAGGGGSILIKNSAAIPGTIGLNARGGVGGNHALTMGQLASPNEAGGPGGGGAGGSITFVAGTPIQNVTGGSAGISTVSGALTTSIVSEFAVNGATNGATGISGITTTTYNITATNQTICSGSPVTLAATTTGTLPGTLSWYTTQFGGSAVATGTSYTPSPAPTTTTTYYVGVCPGSFRVPVVVTVNPKPTIAGTVVLTNPTCSNAGSITGLTVSGGTPAYTYSWNGTSTPGMNCTNIPAGTYNLTVTDVNGCTATSGPHTLVGTAGPIINSTNVVITNQGCNGTLGSITGITATGTGLTYSWSNSGGSTLNTSNLTANSYTLTVTDANGCTATSGPHLVGLIASPTINSTAVSLQNPTCGNNNGTITGLTATGTSLTYAWSPSGGNALNASNLAAGSYTLTVTNGNGCTATSGPHILVAVPGPTINATAVSVVNGNCGQANGSITGLVVNGGTPTLSYVWTNTSQTTLALINVSAGTYTLTVTDGNGCIATAGPYAVANNTGPIINTSNIVVQNQLCNGTMGSITGITATGTGLTYSWTNGGGNSLNPTNLTAGSYSLTVTDGNGCTATSGPHVVGFTAGPTVNSTAVSLQNPTCGNNNGTITGLTATGTSLTYAWSPSGGTALNASSLGAGSYTLTVTNGNGCTATSGPHILVAVPGPTINAAAVSVVNGNCGQANGSITGLVVNGGTPTLTYAWTNTTQTTLALSNLSAGSYSLTITDGNGCIATAGPYAVANNTGPIINTSNAAIQNQLCNGTMGSITGITATGTGLTYSWTNSAGSSLNAANLAAGSYSLTVTDGNGCTASAGPYSVAYTAGPNINSAALVLQNATCGNNNGTITGITASGTGLTYSWSPTGGSALNASNLAAGSYTLTVTDVNGCTATSGPHVISAIAGPTVNSTNIALTPENCGQSNGAITGIIVNGGTPTLTYAWTNTAQTTLNLSDLAAGSYALTVTDGNGCTASAGPFTVTSAGGPSLDEVNAIETDISCSGTLGSITGITATGVGLSYNWSNGGGSSLNATNLSAGTYTLTVTDGSGCATVSSPYTIDAPVPLSIDASNMMTMPTGCAANTGSITGIIVNGGVNPTYSWTNSSATTLDLSNLGAGSYTLTVNDDQGCTDNLTVSITLLNAPTISTATIAINDEHCNQGDGSVTGIIVNGGTPGYTYSWNTAPPTLAESLMNVASGTYTLTATDAAGCTDTEIVTVNEVSGPVINLNTALIVQPTCTLNGSITGISVSGSNPYIYAWTGTSQSTLDISNLTAGSYTLTVTDNYGCQTTSIANVLAAPVGPMVDFVWSPSAPNIDETVVFTNTSIGIGLTNPIWTVEGLSINTTDITHVFTAVGTYVVTLTEEDANGCIGISTQTITIYDELGIPNVVTANNDNLNDTFEISGLKPNTQIIILNRWGEVVFSTNNYLNDWDGKDISGKLLTDGVYTYMVNTTEGKKYHGFVHLIR